MTASTSGSATTARSSPRPASGTSCSTRSSSSSPRWSLELVLGMALALFMHRAIFGRNVVRTAILLPYGIITVVSAFAFQFAVSPNIGGFWHLTSPPLDQPRHVAGRHHRSPRSGRRRRSCRCCCSPASRPSPMTTSRRPRVDGANAWQRLWRVILPNMRVGRAGGGAVPHPGRGAHLRHGLHPDPRGQQHATLSQLGYNQLISQLNLGLGSAVSVLLFIIVIIIAFIFVKGFRTDLGQVRGER